MTFSTEEYARRVVAELQSVRSRGLTVVERTAEAMARRVLQGGRLYIVDDHSGLTSEAVGRAGGLMMIQPLTTTDLGDAGIAAPDILIMCSRRAENASMSILARDARQRGVYDVVDLVIRTHVPYTDGVLTEAWMPTPACPLSGFANPLVFWMLNAEVLRLLNAERGKPV